MTNMADVLSNGVGSHPTTPSRKGRAPSIKEESLMMDPFERMMGAAGAIKQHASDFNLQILAEQMSNVHERAAEEVQTRCPLLSPAFWSCAFYATISVSMILVNKLVLTTYAFKFPMVLLFHQNLMTVLSLYAAKRLGVTTYEPLERHRVLKWLPMDIFFVLMLFTGFYSVQLLSVPMITIFKNANIILIAIGDALLFGNIPSRAVIWTMMLMLGGALMASMNDLEFSKIGYMWTFANCLATTGFVLYAQSAIARTNLSTFGKVYYNNVLALPLVFVVDLFVFGDFHRLLTTDKETFISFLSFDFMLLWFVSGFLGFLQSMASLRAQHLTTPTTYSMVGALNKIPLTFLGIFMFHTPMTTKGVISVTVSIVAGALYSYSKAQEEIKSRATGLENARLAQATAGEKKMMALVAGEKRDGAAGKSTTHNNILHDNSPKKFWSKDEVTVPEDHTHSRFPKKKETRSSSLPSLAVDPDTVTNPNAR